MKKRILISVVFVAVSLLAGTYATLFQISPNKVEASGTQEVRGWLWSDNIGWVSLNCLNTSTCATAAYGVTQNPDGTWTGYGWSDNIGWLDFNGGCPPSAAGTCGAKMDGNNLKGWAKFLSAGAGWDGWVSFSSTNDHDFSTSGVQISPYTYGGTLSGVNVSGYAWGGNIVGWLSLQDVQIEPETPTTSLYLKPAVSGTPVNSSNIAGLPDTISMSNTGNFDLYWYKTTDTVTYTGCTTNSTSATTWTGATVTPVLTLPAFNSGSFSYTAHPGTQTYTISCTRDIASGGGTDVATAYVNGTTNTVSALLTGGGTTYCPVGTPGYVTPVLYWTSINATSCTAPWFTGSNATNNPTSGNQGITTAGSYTVQCTDGINTVDSNTEMIDFLPAQDPACQTKEVCNNRIDDNGNGLIDEGCKKKFNYIEG